MAVFVLWATTRKNHDYIFGMQFFQAKNRTSGGFAAAKIIETKTEEELADYNVEIDVLAACDSEHIVRLMDAYLYEMKLWVRPINTSYSTIVKLFSDNCYFV